jgi:hypothetical protein
MLRTFGGRRESGTWLIQPTPSSSTRLDGLGHKSWWECDTGIAFLNHAPTGASA